VAPLNLLLARLRELLATTEFANNQVLYSLAVLADFVLHQVLQNCPLTMLVSGVQFVAEKCE
jgi:hypothetical protein